MKIAVVDDQCADKERACNFVQTYFSNLCMNVPLEIFNYASGEDFIRDFTKDTFDIILIDCYMKGMNGMELASRIRCADSMVILIFMTVSRDFAVAGYKVKAAGYLMKPFSYQEFEDVIRLIDLEKIRERQFVEFVNGSDRERILIKEIIYCDIDGHYAQVYTKCNGIRRFRMTFAQMTRHLEEYPQFFPCYRGCIINMKEIKKIDERDFLMSNGARIPFRKKEHGKIVQVYSDFLFRQLRSETL